jgi:2-keto-4-pentenoate hydratase/2-oxohepta-3-ene-1,7-dioic acid hydratase in catechol pathway
MEDSVRLATIATPRGLRLHVRGTGGYVDVAEALDEEALRSLTGLLAAAPEVRQRVADLAERDGEPVTPAEFGPAVPDPARVLCIGVNYREHAAEGGRDVPSWPEVFVRGGGSVTGPYADLVRPALSDRYDYEGELGVVIGAGGRYIRAADALDAVAGFVVLNDASARDWQRASTQWTGGKNFDGSMPIGPEVVTPDEVDVTDLELTTTLNGEVMQSANTREMIVDVASCVEFLSSFTTLRPGDVIATGTPGGVGFARTPPVWLTPGDVVEVEVSGVGKIRNVVVEETDSPEKWAWRPSVASSNPLTV